MGRLDDYPVDLEGALGSTGKDIIETVAEIPEVDMSKISMNWVYYDRNGNEIGRTNLIPPILREEIIDAEKEYRQTD